MTSAVMAEQSVIGSILIDPRCLGAVTEVIQKNDFAMTANQDIYTAITQLNRDGDPIDPVTVLKRTNQNGTSVSAEYLMQLMDTTPTAANVREYAKIVREMALRRELGEIAKSMSEDANLATENPESVIARVKKQLDEILSRQLTQDLLSNEDAILHFSEHRLMLESGTNAMAISTGYSSVDKLLGGGFVNSGLHIIAARPGMGKTAFALGVAENTKKTGLLVSLEMDDEQITARRLAQISGIAYNRLMFDHLTDSENQKLAEANDRLIQMKQLYIPKSPTATVEEIQVWAEKIKDLDFVMVDYMGKVDGSDKFGKTEKITQISSDLKKLARRLKKPVIVLSQLSRKCEERPNKRPILSDLRDSGSIEQDADTVIFLYRHDYYDSDRSQYDGISPVELEVNLAKNRHGNIGTRKLDYYPANNRIRGIYTGRSNFPTWPPAPPALATAEKKPAKAKKVEVVPELDQISVNELGETNHG